MTRLALLICVEESPIICTRVAGAEENIQVEVIACVANRALVILTSVTLLAYEYDSIIF